MKSKAKTPKQNVRCNFCGCAFVPEPKTQREGEMNSVNEAMALAVPMVAMPFLNDQITNAKRIVELGIGKRVHSFPSRGKELYETVRSVYADKSIKRNVMQLSSYTWLHYFLFSSSNSSIIS